MALREAEEEATEMATDLGAYGLDVLLEDPNERPGFYVNEADLIGAPIRMTASAHTVGKG